MISFGGGADAWMADAQGGEGRIPFRAVDDGSRAIEFYTRAFAARERRRDAPA